MDVEAVLQTEAVLIGEMVAEASCGRLRDARVAMHDGAQWPGGTGERLRGAAPVACAVGTRWLEGDREEDVRRGIYQFEFGNDSFGEVVAEVRCPLPLRQTLWEMELPPHAPWWAQGFRH